MLNQASLGLNDLNKVIFNATYVGDSFLETLIFLAGSIVRYQLLLLCKSKAFCNHLIYTKHAINYQTALHYFVFYNYFTVSLLAAGFFSKGH